MVLFMLSFFEVPKGVLEKIEYYMSQFFWQNDNHKKKYMLAKWSILCQTKDHGGMGIMNIVVQNECLLSKWLYKLINEEGLWQDLLRNKYMQHKSIGHVQRKPEDSYFWSGLTRIKECFLEHGTFIINDGANTRFWEDRWIGVVPLKQQFPNLYRIIRHKHDSVASVFSKVPLNISFTRSLLGDNLVQWFNLVAKIAHVRLNERADVFGWGFT
jgi:hypothetical protein